MIEGWRHVVAVAGALGSGLMAGFFLAFSTITMSGLRAVAPAEGLRVMQAINRSPNSSPALLVTLLGTGVVSVAAAAMSVGRLDEASSWYLVSGAALYLVGTLGLTIVFHVPRNLAIDALDPSAAASLEEWKVYARIWTAGNHVRTVSSLLAMIAFVLSLRAD